MTNVLIYDPSLTSMVFDQHNLRIEFLETLTDKQKDCLLDYGQLIGHDMRIDWLYGSGNLTPDISSFLIRLIEEYSQSRVWMVSYSDHIVSKIKDEWINVWKEGVI